ncbi:FIG00003370: Multicopper polyphenol oxidase [Olavius algarvensis Delta 1 endosymbiont]|nr:FIG00003370: Multicopper polyphenol oxidase [Olavius algarvensis Delta 1 endosymbiont]
MIQTTQDGTSFYQFEKLAACRGIRHKIFSRNGGHSRGPYSSLNVSFGIGDEDEIVALNRDLIARNMQARDLVFARQVHGVDIAVLEPDRGRPRVAAADPLTADAMVTDQPQRHLVIQVADCQALLLFDPVRQVVANVHCGWRGSIQNIIGCTVETMVQRFDCRPGTIIAGIGPSLGPCCAEFIHYQTEIPPAFWRYKDSSHHFDYWSISCDQLVQAGVAAENIESSGICTRCHTDEFFSYRAAKTTGRFAAVIGMT